MEPNDVAFAAIGGNYVLVGLVADEGNLDKVEKMDIELTLKIWGCLTVVGVLTALWACACDTESELPNRIGFFAGAILWVVLWWLILPLLILVWANAHMTKRRLQKIVDNVRAAK